jgi:hypothetical protein
MQKRSALALSKQSSVIWVAILLLAGGGLVCATGGVTLWEQRSYRAHGRFAEGIVLSKEARTLRGRTLNYYIRYRYTGEDGHAVEEESRLSEQRWRQLGPGQPVRIEYLPAWRTSRVAGEHEGFVPMLLTLIGGVVGSAGALLGFTGMRDCVRQARAMQRGYPTQATVIEVAESPLSVNRLQQWVISYTYRDHQGREHTGRSPCLAPEEASAWKPGDTARIRYDFNRPQHSSWMGREDSTQEMPG